MGKYAIAFPMRVRARTQLSVAVQDSVAFSRNQRYAVKHLLHIRSWLVSERHKDLTGSTKQRSEYG